MQQNLEIERFLFLPGASGVARFWRPVIDRLSSPAESVAFDYPGYGGNPPNAAFQSLNDIAAWVETYIDRPVAILAQSMGGAIAVQLALRNPLMVRRLVLTGTIGGASGRRQPLDSLREGNSQRDLGDFAWLADDTIDMDVRMAHLPIPSLLIFGTNDPIAPRAQGEYLVKLLPNAELVLIDTTSHFFVRDMPDEVAGHIGKFFELDHC
jgi:pimeloyl-ACP methyl ester carboxylesterase